MNEADDVMAEVDDVMTEVQELTWALIDQCASEEEVRRLEQLLLEHEEARRGYVLCMQMHADLHFLLNPPPPPTAVQKIIELKAKQRKVPLPVVDMPATAAFVPATGGQV
jgi:hypothetical protein